MPKISIEGIDKAELLAALYNHSRPLGMGILNYDPKDMTKEEAKEILDTSRTDFDYLKGRVMKVNIKGDELRTDLYNRDNGQGAAEAIVIGLQRR